MTENGAAVDLYWIPVGAGHHVVRLSGALYEAVVARMQRRPALHLYHSALTVDVPGGRFVIEQTPIVDVHGELHGVVVEGPVGTRSIARGTEGWRLDRDYSTEPGVVVCRARYAAASARRATSSFDRIEET